MSGRTPAPRALIAAALLLGAAAAVVAQGRFDAVQIKPEKLADGIWVLTGSGGNIGMCAGPDGVLLVDDQYAELSPKILAAVKTLSDRPLRWIVNTHWHGDHVGGNENMANAGATIVAQDNVRRRMIEGQVDKTSGRKIDPAPAKALPVLTFNDSAAIHVNGEDVVIFHVAAAHTDGDAIVWFRKSNVVHAGDCLFNGLYPRIDLASGGSIDGMIEAANRVIPWLGPDTKVIPGHGPVTDREGYKRFRDMLTGVRDAIAKRAGTGMSLEQTLADAPTRQWDEEWGKGFIKPDVFVKMVYEDLSRKP